MSANFFLTFGIFGISIKVSERIWSFKEKSRKQEHRKRQMTGFLQEKECV